MLTLDDKSKKTIAVLVEDFNSDQTPGGEGWPWSLNDHVVDYASALLQMDPIFGEKYASEVIPSVALGRIIINFPAGLTRDEVLKTLLFFHDNHLTVQASNLNFLLETLSTGPLIDDFSVFFRWSRTPSALEQAEEWTTPNNCVGGSSYAYKFGVNPY
jgi:hypothetical protein